MDREEELLRLLIERADGSREVRILQGELASALGWDVRRVSERLRRICREKGIGIRRTNTGNVYILPEELVEGDDRNRNPASGNLPNNGEASAEMFGKWSVGESSVSTEPLEKPGRRFSPGIPPIEFGKLVD